MAIANYNSKDLKSKYMEFIIDTPADILDLPGLEEAGIWSAHAVIIEYTKIAD